MSSPPKIDRQCPWLNGVLETGGDDRNDIGAQVHQTTFWGHDFIAVSALVTVVVDDCAMLFLLASLFSGIMSWNRFVNWLSRRRRPRHPARPDPWRDKSSPSISTGTDQKKSLTGNKVDSGSDLNYFLISSEPVCNANVDMN